MKPDAHKRIERFRIREGRLASDERYGNNGAFMLPVPDKGGLALQETYHKARVLGVVVSDGEGWDHVSVSLQNRCPTWDEMCFIKELFFEPHEVAMQLHPAKADYVNHHPYCLHLWRPQDKRIPLPPVEFVGPKQEAAQ